MAKVLIEAADFGSPLSRLELSFIVYNYLKSNKEHLFDSKLPGKWRVKIFLIIVDYCFYC